jgi:hypothetical protein
MICTQIFGAWVAFGGFCGLTVPISSAAGDLQNATKSIANDSAAKKVVRVVAEVFKHIGMFSLAMGVLVAGIGIMAMAPQLAFTAVIIAAAEGIVPYLVVSLGCFTAAALSAIYGGNPAPPTVLAAQRRV